VSEGQERHAGRVRAALVGGLAVAVQRGPHDTPDGDDEQDGKDYRRADEGHREGRRGGMGQRGEEADEGAGKSRTHEGVAVRRRQRRRWQHVVGAGDGGVPTPRPSGANVPRPGRRTGTTPCAPPRGARTGRASGQEDDWAPGRGQNHAPGCDEPSRS